MGILKKIEVWFVGMFGSKKLHPAVAAAAAAATNPLPPGAQAQLLAGLQAQRASMAAAGNVTGMAILDAQIAALGAQTAPVHGNTMRDEKESEGGSVSAALGCDKR